MLSKNLAATRKLMKLIDETTELRASLENELRRVEMEIEDICNPDTEQAGLEEPGEFLLANRQQLRRIADAARELSVYAKTCADEYTKVLNDCTEESPFAGDIR